MAADAGICGDLPTRQRPSCGASIAAGYLSGGRDADEALKAGSPAPADQSGRGHVALVHAVQRGVLPAETGI